MTPSLNVVLVAWAMTRITNDEMYRKTGMKKSIEAESDPKILRYFSKCTMQDLPPCLCNKRPDTIVFVVYFFLIFFLFCCQNSQAFESPNPVILELRSDFRSIGFYSIKIYKDGKVHYQDNIKRDSDTLYKADGIAGDRYAKLTREQVDELVKDFLSLPFSELAKYDGKRGIGIGWSETIHLKLEDTQIDIVNTFYYRALLTKLKKYIAIYLKTWLCFPEEHKYYREDCPNYLPDNFKF